MGGALVTTSVNLLFVANQNHRVHLGFQHQYQVSLALCHPVALFVQGGLLAGVVRSFTTRSSCCCAHHSGTISGACCTDGANVSNCGAPGGTAVNTDSVPTCASVAGHAVVCCGNALGDICCTLQLQPTVALCLGTCSCSYCCCSSLVPRLTCKPLTHTHICAS